MQKPSLILYELNEVPWRVFDWYAMLRPNSTIAALLKDSALYTTHTRDEGELHPWSTWPTLHRGVYNTQHKILFINQDKSCASAYPPIWEELALRGVRVGVFGSLQSYPAPRASESSYCFYVPDTFAPSPETLPAAYRSFQLINLRQTKSDGAVAQPVTIDRDMLSAIVKLPSIGVRLGTLALLFKQLVRERLDSAYRARRAILQAPIAFDVFRHAFLQHQPEFSTFFTNHVAGAMHRYWKYAFPEDFGYRMHGAGDRFKRETLVFAMDIADKQLGELKKLVDRKGGCLVVASSMGQQAINRGADYQGELRLHDAGKLVHAVGFDQPWKDLLAMQPDFNFEFESEGAAADFVRLALRLHSSSGAPLWFRVRQEGRSINLGMSSSAEIVRDGYLILRPQRLDEVSRRLTLEDVGIKIIGRDPGTGYHQPFGTLIWYGEPERTQAGRVEIESVVVRDMILKHFSCRR